MKRTLDLQGRRHPGVKRLTVPVCIGGNGIKINELMII
jgi:hypothetical protein